MLVLVAGPLVAGHPCVQSDLRSRSSEPAGTQYLRGPTATYATADVRSLPAHMATPFAHAEASPPRRAGGGRASRARRLRHQGVLSLAQLPAAAAATAAAAAAAARAAARAAAAASAPMAARAAAGRLPARVRWTRVPAKRHAQRCSTPHAPWAAPLPRRVPRLATRAGGAARAIAKPAARALPRERDPLPRARLDRATRRRRRARSRLR